MCCSWDVLLVTMLSLPLLTTVMMIMMMMMMPKRERCRVAARLAVRRSGVEDVISVCPW